MAKRGMNGQRRSSGLDNQRKEGSYDPCPKARELGGTSLIGWDKEVGGALGNLVENSYARIFSSNHSIVSPRDRTSSAPDDKTISST